MAGVSGTPWTKTAVMAPILARRSPAGRSGDVKRPEKFGPAPAPEVDEFIAAIEATLSGNARPGHAITAADVQAVTFNVTRHAGYDQRVMDQVLDHYAHELDKLTPFTQP